MLLDYVLLFFEQLARFFIVISVLTLLGYLLLFRRRPLSFNNLFFSLFAGVTIVSLLSSIIYTSFVTVQVVILLLMTFAFLEVKFFDDKRPNTDSMISLPPKVLLGAYFIIPLVLIFSWSFFQYTQPGDFRHFVPAVNNLQANDYIINSFRSHFLKVSGAENYFHAINLIDHTYQGVKPYHYYEMWLNVGVTDLVGGLNASNFGLITFPIFHFLSFLGVLTVWEHKASLNTWAIVVALILLLFAGLHLPFYDYLGVKSMNLPVLSYRLKMAVYYPFLLAFIIEFLKGHKVSAILLLLGLPVATIVAAPGIFGGLTIFLTIMSIFKLIDRSLLLRCSTYVLLTALAIGCFYFLAGSGGPSIREGIQMKDLATELFSLERLSSFFNEKLPLTLKELWRFSLFYWPFALIVWLLRGQLKDVQGLSQMIALLGSILLMALCAYLIFSDQADALQLSYNLFISIFNSLFIFLLLTIIASSVVHPPTGKNERISLVILIVLVACSGILQTKPFIKNTFFRTPQYSDQYLTAIKEYFKNQPAIMLGGTLNDVEDFHSSFSFQVAAYSGGYHLAFMTNGAVPISLSDMEVTAHSPAEGRDLANGAFYQYVTKLKASGGFSSVVESQLAFIKENQIKFLVVSKNAKLSHALKEEADNMIVDELSKERFLILK